MSIYLMCCWFFHKCIHIGRSKANYSPVGPITAQPLHPLITHFKSHCLLTWRLGNNNRCSRTSSLKLLSDINVLKIRVHPSGSRIPATSVGTPAPTLINHPIIWQQCIQTWRYQENLLKFKLRHWQEKGGLSKFECDMVVGLDWAFQKLRLCYTTFSSENSFIRKRENIQRVAVFVENMPCWHQRSEENGRLWL